MKSLLNISDLNKDDFETILTFSSLIKPNIEDCLKNKNIGLIFEKNSTRTRLSYEGRSKTNVFNSSLSMSWNINNISNVKPFLQ